jgi:serine/threonine protein kinase
MTDDHTRPGAEDERTLPIDNEHLENDETVGGFRIVRRLGEGGMGVVWEAEQDHPRRRVALNVMHQHHRVDELHARMFHREAESLGRLRHPNIAALYESGHTEDGHDYFAMELVPGTTLDGWLSTRPATVNPAELRLRLGLFDQAAPFLEESLELLGDGEMDRPNDAAVWRQRAEAAAGVE